MKNTLLDWLEKRISITEMERENSDEFNIQITKGAKIKVYKEIMEFVKTHPEVTTLEDIDEHY